MQKKLMKISQYQRQFFCPGSEPELSTLRKWINNGDLPGVIIGRNFYIDVNKLDLTGNPLVDAVLEAS